ncbi:MULTISPECIES: hypothetical protein [unclassified Clostridium]|uniref:hypothetical protein n=1 Tax=unclassified Clostridium TaxID=2614128 RepID=UPI00189C3BF6|nr:MULTISPECIES: hypothetical protein [unclassified Clostridium]MCR1949510.1 hypothetical protein [Clostridium sp. DSM 100503]
MKKFIAIIFISLFLNFNIVKANPQISSNILKEGVYNVNDITNTIGNVKNVQNISKDGSIYLILLDKNETVLQTIKMKPESQKYTLNDFEKNYKLILIGDGSAFLS